MSDRLRFGETKTKHISEVLIKTFNVIEERN